MACGVPCSTSDGLRSKMRCAMRALYSLSVGLGAAGAAAARAATTPGGGVKVQAVIASAAQAQAQIAAPAVSREEETDIARMIVLPGGMLLKW